jgi:hypothetical protein
MEPECYGNPGAYWLTYARLFELAILCAGTYADHFELTAAGDLLVNPRLIMVHFRSGCRALKKGRHTKLTEQFAHVAGNPGEVVTWLKRETIPEIVEKPLLPHMQERMTQAGFLSKEYLDLVAQRMERIADALGFLAAWHLADSSAFYLRAQCAGPSERRFIESSLCRFDKKIFFELGNEFRRLTADQGRYSRFVDHPSAAERATGLDHCPESIQR